MKLVFLGVGKMGRPMARHLLAGGHAVAVHDTDAQRLALAQAAGLTVATDLGVALAQADGAMSSLPHDAALHSAAVLVAQHLPPGAFYLDTSTVSVAASATVAKLFAPSGCDYLRVTVSGNNHMAEAGQLTLMASGPQAVWQRVAPLLKPWGSVQFYLGEGEQARLMKLVINLMIGQTSAMLAEALSLGRKGGLAWTDLWQVIGASAVASPIVKAKAVQLSQRDFTPTFTVPQMLKDIDLILAEGNALQVPLLQTAMTRQMMQSALAQGWADQDYAAIIKVVEQSAGIHQE
jgi:3-hydroxyisobutyrate dehydrogenase-like beta-hydroxyacid dehydrogenase